MLQSALWWTWVQIPKLNYLLFLLFLQKFQLDIFDSWKKLDKIINRINNFINNLPSFFPPRLKFFLWSSKRNFFWTHLLDDLYFNAE